MVQRPVSSKCAEGVEGVTESQGAYGGGGTSMGVGIVPNRLIVFPYGPLIVIL